MPRRLHKESLVSNMQNCVELNKIILLSCYYYSCVLNFGKIEGPKQIIPKLPLIVKAIVATKVCSIRTVLFLHCLFYNVWPSDNNLVLAS